MKPTSKERLRRQHRPPRALRQREPRTRGGEKIKIQSLGCKKVKLKKQKATAITIGEIRKETRRTGESGKPSTDRQYTGEIGTQRRLNRPERGDEAQGEKGHVQVLTSRGNVGGRPYGLAQIGKRRPAKLSIVENPRKP